MIPEGELRLISSWTTPTTLDHPYYTVLLYCMINGKILKYCIITLRYALLQGYIRVGHTPLYYYAGKNLEFGDCNRSTETSSWDEPLTECMYFNPYFSLVYSTAKVEIKMHVLYSVCVSSQLHVSVLFISVRTNIENSNFFQLCNCTATRTIENMLFLLCTGMIIVWQWYGDWVI